MLSAGSLAVGSYNFTVTATSAFDTTSQATAAVEVRPSGVAPVISIVGASDRTYFIKDGFKVTTALVPESVCDGAKVRVWMGEGSGVVHAAGMGWLMCVRVGEAVGRSVRGSRDHD